jgi:hypothetical protein
LLEKKATTKKNRKSGASGRRTERTMLTREVEKRGMEGTEIFCDITTDVGERKGAGFESLELAMQTQHGSERSPVLLYRCGELRRLRE